MHNRLVQIVTGLLCCFSVPLMAQPIVVNPAIKTASISPNMWGVFFEDINMGADGGIYAEMIKNRSFEFQKPLMGWKLDNKPFREGAITVQNRQQANTNNPRFIRVQATDVAGTVLSMTNEGFRGMAVKKDLRYDFSCLYHHADNQTDVRMQLELIDTLGKTLGGAIIQPAVSAGKWSKFTASFTATASNAKAKFRITFTGRGSIDLDMISLFPQKTFMERKNGLRADLAQAIADIHPRFIRFPGGCVAHGDGIDNIYRWKNTVGSLESRKPQKNLWGYHQTAGLGYFEYFQFCEDIGAAPLPVIAAGVPCQNSATGGAGQQGGIPMCDMDDYVQEVLDLIEWANGDATTKWGKIRAEAGHPKPFNLKYVGIGNEDLINDIFEERFTMIFNAVKEKYPEITVIGTVGPSFEGTDYVEGWKIATKLQVPMVDEHYYQSPGWFIHNQDYYDKYDRSKPKVYLGEYASHLPGRVTNIETALSEALYLTACERNGDVVSMTSYAPLLAKEGHTQWNPDLIYFNNSEVKSTVDYFVQQLYGQNSGDIYLTSDIKLSDKNESVRKRVAVSVVRDSKSNDLIVKMVNMLPVVVNTNVRLDGMSGFRTSAIRTVLSGTPTDKKARPVTDQIAVSGEFPCTLPAYSFSVIRIKQKME